MSADDQTFAKNINGWYKDEDFIELLSKYRLCRILDIAQLSIDQFIEIFKRLTESFNKQDIIEILQHVRVDFADSKANYFLVIDFLSKILGVPLLSDIKAYFQNLLKQNVQGNNTAPITPIQYVRVPERISTISLPLFTITPEVVCTTEENTRYLRSCEKIEEDFHKIYEVLEIAAKEGDESTIKVACEEKYTHIRNGYTFLNRDMILNAAFRGNLPLVKMLYKFGANIKSRDIHNNTILHYFCGSGDIEGVKFALQFIDINDKAYNNFVPLHAAAFKNRANICEYLCTIPEIDKNAKSQDIGLTPLGYATVRRNKETVNILKRLGCAE